MAKFWLPRTCSENHGCIFEVSVTTLTGISKTCMGHSGDFGRTIGVPSNGIIHNNPISGDQAIFDTIRTQNRAGTEEIVVPEFIAFDQLRFGDLSAFGMTPLLTLYQSQTHPGGDQSLPPNPTFINNSFASIAAANPGVTRVCIDLEGYYQGGGSQAIPADKIQHFVDFVDIAHDYWPDVGLYAGIPERYTGHLIPGLAPATALSRYNSWVARNDSYQPIWDVVNSIYPSLYYINPTHNNATQRDQWYDDNINISHMFAPGKPIYPFMWPTYHPSLPAEFDGLDVDGDYWRASLEKLYLIADGISFWEVSSHPDARTQNPVPAWWTQTVDFLDDKGITP